MSATYTLEWPARRNHYVAQVTSDGGPLSREFSNGVKVGKNYRHKLTPGWYELGSVVPARERCQGHDGCRCRDDGKRKAYGAVTTAGQWVELPDSLPTMIEAIVAGPLPLEAGTWNGTRCECGQEVEHYSADGWPYCAEHAPQEQADDATDTEGLIAA